MKYITSILALVLFVKVEAQSTKFNAPIVTKAVVFLENENVIAVEAEHFYKQTKSTVREWYRTSRTEFPCVGRDEDKPHWEGASNGAYLEILPDERVVNTDALKRGDNFSNKPGELGIVHYKVKFNKPGRYYVWARSFSTGGEDNGLHLGVDGLWPEHGKRMQWCQKKGSWAWASKQRTKEQKCGVPKEIYLDIKTPGVHDVQFSMREDGFEFDKFILTTNPNYTPFGFGPKSVMSKKEIATNQTKKITKSKVVKVASKPKKAIVRKTIVKKAPIKVNKPLNNGRSSSFNKKKKPNYFNRVSKLSQENYSLSALKFTTQGTNFYVNKNKWLAIDPNKFKQAKASVTFNFTSNVYDVIFVGVGENDGSSSFKILINDTPIRDFKTPISQEVFEEGAKYNTLIKSIKLKQGDTITVIANVGTLDNLEFTRGRWSGLIFVPEGEGALYID